VFGMGTGVASSLEPPEIDLPRTEQMNRVPAIVLVSNPRSMVKPHGQLVSVSSTHYCAYTSDLSTS
jgi:hypothetical protein